MRAVGSERSFAAINGALFVILCVTMLAPMVHILALSLSASRYLNSNVVSFYPRGFTTAGYRHILEQLSIWRAMGVSVVITVGGTAFSLMLASTLAYSLSRSFMPARRLILRAVILTFIFSIPLIPSYLLIRSLRLYNTLWALMIPNAVGAYGVIIMKTFFQGIDGALFDAATIDGCSEFMIYLYVVIPLSTAVMATLALFHAVGQWNMYFSAIVYIRSRELYPIQVLLRNLVIENEIDGLAIGDDPAVVSYTPEQLKAGTIMVATFPILVVYPFIQKYFVKGARLGSLKE